MKTVKFILISIFLFALPSFGELPKNSIYQLDQKWTTQAGKLLTLPQLVGGPIIATMTYTSCPGACPLTVSDIKSFDRKLTKSEKRQIKFLTFSIDPQRDTPEALNKFYKKMHLDRRWTLLTSDAEQVRVLAAILGFGYKDIGGEDFTHASTLYLLSAEGEILARKDRSSDWNEFLEKFRAQINKTNKIKKM